KGRNSSTPKRVVKAQATSLAAAVRHPFGSYGLMLLLGLIPVALVTQYYDVLPNRLIIQWDAFGNTTLIGTRARTVLLIANVAAVVGLSATTLAIWQHRSLVALGVRRAYLGLNFAQLVVINLTCAMIVSQALGLHLTIKPMVAPAMAVLLFAAGILSWRLKEGRHERAARGAAVVLIGASAVLLPLAAIA